MQKLPLFSILIANYNCGRYIKDCIQSVIVQTYTNWEIVFVDDCSTDDSKEIVKSFADGCGSKIKIYSNITKKGCTFTKSECIKHAVGDLCGFLDADDLLTPDAIEKMVKAFLNQEEDVSIVSSRYYIVDEYLNILGKNRLLNFNGISYLEGRDYSPEHFVAFRRQSYLKTKGLDVTHKYGDDQELYLLLEEVGRWIVLDDFMYYYRQSNKSVCHTSTYECYFWNIIVRYEACVRRGIDVGSIPLLDYFDVLEEYGALKKSEAEQQIRGTKSYKLGSGLLKLIKCVFPIHIHEK